MFVATLCRSTFGFGDALIAMPLLTLLLGVRTASPVVALTGVLIAILVALDARAHVDWRAARDLLIAAAVGVPLGAIAVKVLPESAISEGLGVLLISYAIYAAFPGSGPRLESKHWAWPFGVVSGWLAGAINASGPPVVIFAALRHWDPQRTRATLQAFFLPLSAFVAVAHGATGLWTKQVAVLSATSIPALVAAAYLGRVLNRMVPPDKFTRIIQIILAGPGLLLLLTS